MGGEAKGAGSRAGRWRARRGTGSVPRLLIGEPGEMRPEPIPAAAIAVRIRNAPSVAFEETRCTP